MSISILLADDQPMLRLGFRLVLDAQDDMAVVGEAGDGAAALRLVQAKHPDVVLMDVRMPGMDGIEATRRIVASASTTRVLILTTFDLDEYVYAGLRAGASGFLLKDVPPNDLLSAIRAVASGDAVVAPAVTRRLLDAFLPHLPDPGAGAAARGEGADRAGTRDPHRGRGRPVKRRDRRAARPGRGHREDPRRPDAEQTRPARPGPGRGLRLRARPGPPSVPPLIRSGLHARAHR